MADNSDNFIISAPELVLHPCEPNDYNYVRKNDGVDDFSEFISNILQKNIVPKRSISMCAYSYNDYLKMISNKNDNFLPRYNITVVDSKKQYKISKKSKLKAATLIVPNGREHEFLFSNDEGRLQLLSDSHYVRMIFVYFCRDIVYGNLAKIQSELSSIIPYLVPLQCLNNNENIENNELLPFVIPGGDNLGHRKTIHTSYSDIVGNILIEDVVINSKKTRRLIFLSNPNMIQSEILLTDIDIDYGYLCFPVHQAIIAGLSLTHSLPHMNIESYISTNEEKGKSEEYLSIEDKPIIPITMKINKNLILSESHNKLCNILIIGLGGGNLPMFFLHFFPSMNIEIVEIDPIVVDIAEKFFGYIKNDDNRIKTYVDDGLDFINNLSSEITDYEELFEDSEINDNFSCNRKDIIILDVSSNDEDISNGLSCPPSSFVNIEFLKKLKKCLNPKGMLMFNLVSRSNNLRNEIFDNIRTVFAEVHDLSLEGDVNRVVYALPSCHETPLTFSDIYGRVPMCSNEKPWNSSLDFVKIISNIHLDKKKIIESSKGNTTIQKSRAQREKEKHKLRKQKAKELKSKRK